MTTQISIIEGFSRLSREEQENLIIRTYGLDNSDSLLLASFRHGDPDTQKTIESFSENTLSNYHIPLGIAPNFLINGRMYALPMLTEESSVVAAAANAAKFWARKGGFRTRVYSTIKTGQVHFTWAGPPDLLYQAWPQMQKELFSAVAPVEESMKKRGGGLTRISLREMTNIKPGYFQADAEFETSDAMGANFINTCLETMAGRIYSFFRDHPVLSGHEKPRIIMSILSNYTPDCIAEASVSCPVGDLEDAPGGLRPQEFAEKFREAVDIAGIDIKRAVTHNKGIMNGVDALVLATGNDFRAVEANAHAYASKNGSYRGLSECSLENDTFTFTLRLPLAIGTVGGLTTLHPLARFSIDLLGKPKAKDLMQITAAAGLASNFAAISSLITSGIQKGHMKLHLANIINTIGATANESDNIYQHFAHNTVSVSEVKKYLDHIRGK